MEALLSLPLPYAHYWLAVWLSAAAAAIAWGVSTRQGPWRTLGLALMTVPLWTAVWSFINSIPALTDPGSFIPPRSTYRLSSAYLRSLLVDLGYLGAGFLLWTRAQGWPTSLRGLAARLPTPLFRVPEGRAVASGTLLFPLVLAVTVLFDILVRSQLPALINGDESRIWENMTPFHAVMISAAAAVTEELTYRLLLMGGILAVARRWLAARPAAWVVVTGQALLFALAHGGYGTIYHVLAPLGFGLIAGVLAWRFGLWAAIAIHFWIDFYVFGAYVESAAWLALLWTLLVLNAAATLAWLGRSLLRAKRQGGAPDAGP